MVETRVLLVALLTALPCTANWTTQQQEWALGTSALLCQMAGQRHDLLAGAENRATVAAADRSALVQSWGIRSREDLIKIVRSLAANTSDPMQIGWNYPGKRGRTRPSHNSMFLVARETFRPSPGSTWFLTRKHHSR
jgi:hypothetical protein